MNNSFPYSPHSKKSSSKSGPVDAVKAGLSRLKKPTAAQVKIIVIVVVSLVVVIGQGLIIFNYGKQKGIAEGKKQVASRSSANAARPGTPANMAKRWALSGSITKTADGSFVLKAKNGQESTVILDDKTIVQSADGKKLTVKELKKDATVFASGTTKPDGGLLAQRVRI